MFIEVSDEEILTAQKMLGREGIGVEPASAASFAGYIKALREGLVDARDKVVLIATGHALKDPDILLMGSGSNVISVLSIDELILSVPSILLLNVNVIEKIKSS